MNRTFGVVAVTAVAAVSLAGCGGSSGGTSSSSSSSSTTSTSTAAAGTACSKVQADLGQLATVGPTLLASPSAAGPQVQQLAAKMKTDASTGSAALQTAVNNFVSKLQATLQQVQSSKSSPNTTQIETDLTTAAGPITAACPSSSASSS